MLEFRKKQVRAELSEYVYDTYTENGLLIIHETANSLVCPTFKFKKQAMVLFYSYKPL